MRAHATARRPTSPDVFTRIVHILVEDGKPHRSLIPILAQLADALHREGTIRGTWEETLLRVRRRAAPAAR